MKRILLTGTTGFLGSEFISYILKNPNYEITEIVRSKKKFKKKNRYKRIVFKNYKKLDKDLEDKKFDIFINFATFYKNNHTKDDILTMNNANILFPNFILEKIIKNLKKFITFGSMMEYSGQIFFKPKNYYSSTKKAFESILQFYKLNFKKCKFYNIKLYETFGVNDNRNKILPTIIKAYQKNKSVRIINKNLKLNIILSDELNSFIEKLISKNLRNSNYILQNKKNTHILDLIKKANITNNRKIKYKLYKKKIINKFSNNVYDAKTIKINSKIEKYFLKVINENNKN